MDWELPAECSHLEGEAGYCLTTLYDRWTLIGTDTGTVCSFGEPEVEPQPYNGFAWQDRHAVFCEDYRVKRQNLDTFEVEETDHGCTAIAQSTGTLLVVDHNLSSTTDRVARYGAFEDIQTGAEPIELLSLSLSNTRVSADDFRFYSTWHSTDEYRAQDLAPGFAPVDFPLTGHDGWIHGIDPVDSQLMLLSRDELKRVDLKTGTVVDTVELDGLFPGAVGLECLFAGAR